MKKTNALLLLLISLCFSGCEDKKTDSKPLMVENTTEVFTPKDKQIQHQKRTITKKTESKTTPSVSSGDFILSNHSTSHSITLTDKVFSSDSIDQPIVLLVVHSNPSKLVSSLTALQKKYKKDLFIASISSSDSQDINNNAKYFVSNNSQNEKMISQLYAALSPDINDTLSLSVIYKEGTYYSHFEGPVPIEMLIHDIQNAIEN